MGSIPAIIGIEDRNKWLSLIFPACAVPTVSSLLEKEHKHENSRSAFEQAISMEGFEGPLSGSERSASQATLRG
jgi:hypothetical protein